METGKALEVQATSLVSVSKHAVKELEIQRKLLADFVRGQLKEADFSRKVEGTAAYGEGDYGIIPGTKKRCLFKPGAEKLLRLFGLGVRFKQIEKDIDKSANFALYTYAAEIYVIRTGEVVSNCEATANSQEVKYKERTVWKTNSHGNRESLKEETPIFDVLNTLQKMAQKRALIGATLLATGASEYFTQDMLEPDDIERTVVDVTPKAARSEPSESVADSSAPPQCCGRPMMLSKYVDKDLGHKPWYCMECRGKKPAVA